MGKMLLQLHLSWAILALLAAAAAAVWDCEEMYKDKPNMWGYRMDSAAEANDIACVKYFLKVGDDPNRGNKLAERPIHYAAGKNAGGVIQVLFDYYAYPNYVTGYQETALMIASCNGRVNGITVLIRGGADVDFTNIRGENASSVACTCSGVGPDCPKETILMLLDTSGPGIPCEELYKDDPQGFGHRLQYAIRAEDLYCTQAFLQMGDNVNQWDRFGVTPLMDAAKTRSTEVLQTVLRYGALGNERDVGKFSPLMYGSCYGVDNNVDVLVDAGVKTGYTDINGETAADLACTCTEGSCREEKIVDKIEELRLKTRFNIHPMSDEGILNDGTRDITQNNRDCNELCQRREGCKTWTRIKTTTATNRTGECWLRDRRPKGGNYIASDTGRIRIDDTSVSLT